MPIPNGDCGCGRTVSVASRTTVGEAADHSIAGQELHGFARPRFHANQLLTEEDLRRLDDYIVGKQRLHNRHFHDWGVVCGLVVSCAECISGEVLVAPGHALTSRGEDVIVPKLERVDVRAWLTANAPDEKCPDPVEDTEEQKLLLSVHYEEELRGRPGGCACGCSEGCRCHGKERACEPSVVCEGYRLELTKLDGDPSPGQGTPPVGFMGTALECVQPLFDWVASLQGGAEDTPPAEWLLQKLNELKWVLVEMAAGASAMACNIEQRLHAIVIPSELPDVDDQQAVQEFLRVFFELIGASATIVQACICRAALPPCPKLDCGGIPLATLTVRVHDGTVTRVCNWGRRKLAHALPNIDYWTAPVLESLKQRLAAFCCTPVETDFDEEVQWGKKGHVKLFSKAPSMLQWTSLGVQALRRALPDVLVDMMSAEDMQMGVAHLVVALADHPKAVTPARMLQTMAALELRRVQSPLSSTTAKVAADGDVAMLRRELDLLRERLERLESS